MEFIIIVALVTAVLLLHRPLSALFNKLYISRQQHKFIECETFYHSVVSKYIRYYNRLNLEDQRKFLFRTFLFRKARTLSLYRSKGKCRNAHSDQCSGRSAYFRSR